MTQVTPSDSTTQSFSTFEYACKCDPHKRRLVSDLYALLLLHTTSSPHLLQTNGSKDLDLQTDAINWAQIWQATKSASPNIESLETNYKVLTRWYLVPARISKFLPQYPSHCFRECNASGTHIHIWWECPKACIFWSEVFQILSTMFNATLPSDQTVALLNSKPQALTHCQFKLLLFVTTAGKQSIAKAWNLTSLSILSVKQRVTQAMIHAKTEAIFLDKVSKFKKLWNPWINHGLPPGFDCLLIKL